MTTPLEQVSDLLEQAIEESRSLTAEFSLTVLYEQALTAGLEGLGRRTQEQHGLAVDVEAVPDANPAGEAERVLLFQTARESALQRREARGGRSGTSAFTARRCAPYRVGRV